MQSYLIVGDGNFSFSLALCRRGLSTHNVCKVVATSLESLATVLTRTHAEENLRKLRLCKDVWVMHEVDGTHLGDHQGLKALSLLYDAIIFNFPHTGGKNKIRSNQTLLNSFFVSASSSGLLAVEGEVHVTLCHGQGGTPADSGHRGYENSWKVVEMAAEGGLVLDRIESFMRSDVPGYTPTGYRGHSDKGFSLDGALRHVFRFPVPSKHSLYPPCYLHDVSFWSTEREFDLKMFRGVVEEVTRGDSGVRDVEVMGVKSVVGNEVEGSSVASVELLEVYKPPVSDAVRSDSEVMMCGGDDGKAARIGYCYRVSYQSCWAAISRSEAGQLQQLLRQALQSKAGLELR